MRILPRSTAPARPTGAAPDAPHPSRAAVMRGLLLRMVLWVLAIDAAAIATYYAAGLERADARTRFLFTLAWSVATIVVVLTALRRIRLARRGR